MKDETSNLSNFINNNNWSLDPIKDEVIINNITKSSLAADTLSFIKQYIIRFNVKNVLEFGSGISTLLITKVFHDIIKINDYNFISVDDSIKYLNETITKVQRYYPENKVKFIHAPIEKILFKKKLYKSYSNSKLYNYIKELKLDLLLIDGPSGRKYGREVPLYISFPGITEHTLILLDDSNRINEKKDLAVWKMIFKDNIEIYEMDHFLKGLTLIKLLKPVDKMINPFFLNKNILIYKA